MLQQMIKNGRGKKQKFNYMYIVILMDIKIFHKIFPFDLNNQKLSNSTMKRFWTPQYLLRKTNNN